MYLNTSHVLIYLKRSYNPVTCSGNLNTSHVLIYPLGFKAPGKSMLNLNTSHVLIYQKWLGISFSAKRI